jgi:hypothetical protein
MGRLAHAFLSAGDNHLGRTVLYLLGAERNSA